MRFLIPFSIAVSVFAAGNLGTARADATTVRSEEGLTEHEVIRISNELAQKLGIPGDKLSALQTRVRELLTDPSFTSSHQPVTGVMVMQRGGGGFLLKV